MDGMRVGFEYFGRGMLDGLILFMVIPLSIPVFLGLHFLSAGQRFKALICGSISLLITLVYIYIAGIRAALFVLLYIAIFYFLLVMPFWLMDAAIKWHDKKYIYDKYLKKASFRDN